MLHDHKLPTSVAGPGIVMQSGVSGDHCCCQNLNPTLNPTTIGNDFDATVYGAVPVVENVDSNEHG